MIRTALIAGAAGLALAAAVAPAAVQAQSFRQIFISPAGEPFRARSDEPFPVSRWFKQADTDADGALSLDEFKADSLRFFRVIDVDKDDHITGYENTRYEKEVAPEILFDAGQLASNAPPSKVQYERGPLGEAPEVQGSGSRIGMAKTRRPSLDTIRRGAGQFSFFNEPQPIRVADHNLDFVVSSEEWTKTAIRRFGQLDLNKDGKIQASELPQTPFQILLVKRR
jgi:hypothetical protein